MEYKNHNHLIDKYFKGQTTLKEEKAIKELLSNYSDSTDRYSEMGSYFSYVTYRQEKSKVMKLRLRKTYRFAGVAALAATICFAFFLPFGNFTKQKAPNEQVVYISDLEQQELLESYEHFKSYMINASEKLNQGMNS
ncbi:MAG: hypothetical protein OXC67_10830, partial [Flavobacteriaceae bacterium]|nr:hypothetical protein [Flavobacteriaceae bacterium]